MQNYDIYIPGLSNESNGIPSYPNNRRFYNVHLSFYRLWRRTAMPGHHNHGVEPGPLPPPPPAALRPAGYPVGVLLELLVYSLQLFGKTGHISQPHVITFDAEQRTL